MRSIALASLFFFSTGLHAEDGFFSRLCGPVVNEMARAHAVYVKACEQEMKSLGCDQYFAENFVPREYKRDCNDPPGLLSNSNLRATAWCPVEFGTGVVMGDLIVDPLVAVYEALKNEEDDFSQPAKRVSRRERAENYRRAIREQVDYLALPHEEKLRLYEEAQAEANRRRAGEQTIKKWLSDAGIAIGCYNDVKYKELLCYGAGAAVGTIGIVKGVKYLGNLAYKGAGKAGEWGAKILRAAGIDPSRTKLLSESAAKVEARLGYKPSITDASRTNENFVKIQARNPAGEEIAMFTGELKEGGKFLDYTYANIPNTANRKTGLFDYILGETLARNPKITKLGGSLSDGVTMDAYKAARAAGASCAQAIAATAGYKAFARAGFGRIVTAECDGIAPYFVVERGS